MIGAGGPGYWMHETGGVLRPVIEAYLDGQPLTAMQIAAMRAYLRQWISAPVWDRNPHYTPTFEGAIERAVLDDLRRRVENLVDRAAIDRWLADAERNGFDPL